MALQQRSCIRMALRRLPMLIVSLMQAMALLVFSMLACIHAVFQNVLDVLGLFQGLGCMPDVLPTPAVHVLPQSICHRIHSTGCTGLQTHTCSVQMRNALDNACAAAAVLLKCETCRVIVGEVWGGFVGCGCCSGYSSRCFFTFQSNV